MKDLNNIIYKGIVLFLVVFLMTGCEGCKDKPECINANADFTVKQYINLGFNTYKFEEEIFLTPGTLFFNIIDTLAADSVWWKIGYENEYRRGETLRLDFQNALEDSDLQIEVIVFKKPVETCKNDFISRDTFYSSISVTNRKNTIVDGEYLGYFEKSPSEMISFRIKRKGSYPTFALLGLPESCTEYSDSDPFLDRPLVFPSFKHFMIYSDIVTSIEECAQINGFGSYDVENNELKMVIDYKEQGKELEKKVFIGSKIE